MKQKTCSLWNIRNSCWNQNKSWWKSKFKLYNHNVEYLKWKCHCLELTDNLKGLHIFSGLRNMLFYMTNRTIEMWIWKQKERFCCGQDLRNPKTLLVANEFDEGQRISWTSEWEWFKTWKTDITRCTWRYSRRDCSLAYTCILWHKISVRLLKYNVKLGCWVNQ